MNKLKLNDKHRSEFECKFSKEVIERFCHLLSTNFGFDLYENTDWQGLDSEVPADLRAIVRLLNSASIDKDRDGLFIPFSYIANQVLELQDKGSDEND